MGPHTAAPALMQERDAYFMGLALEQARAAQAQAEVPVGAVVVLGDTVVGTGFNRVIADHDPSAHAEIVALRAAARTLRNYRLDACEMYVTLEPCMMCRGAVQHSRIRRLVYGASDSHRLDATGQSVEAVDQTTGVSLQMPGAPACEIKAGCRRDECARLLQGFFQQRRSAQSQDKERLRDDAVRADAQARERLQAIGWTAQGQYVTPPLAALNGLRMHVWRFPPPAATPSSLLVCLHGHGVWALQFHALLQNGASDHARDMLLVDRPGHGWSDKSKKGWEHDPTIQQAAAAELLQRYPHSHIDLLAHDGAAALAWNLAQTDSRIRSLTLLNPCRYGEMLPPDPSKAAAVAQGSGLPWARITTLAGLQRWWSLRPDCAGQGLHMRDALLWPLPDDGHVAGWSRYLRCACTGVDEYRLPATAPAQVPATAGATAPRWSLRILCNEQYRAHAEAFCALRGIAQTHSVIERCAETESLIERFAATALRS
ncbi:MAG: tRNA adenosine(34) deaminase TadA [Rhodoferax sp.]